MNYPTYALVLAMLSLTPLSAHARDNLPDLNAPGQVGRITLYPTPKRITWALPMAFSSRLDCPPASPSNPLGRQACLLKVFNVLTEEEQNELLARQQSGRAQIAFFDRLNSPIVKAIREDFEGITSSLTPLNSQTSETLMLTGNKTPYASFALKGNAEELQKLKETYASNGIGVFKSEVTFLGENTETYLEMKNTRALRQFMENSLTRPVTSRELAAAVKVWMDSGQFSVLGLTNEEACFQAQRFLLTHQFKRSRRSGKYLADQQALDTLKPSELIIDDRNWEVPMTCTATLLLKQGGTNQSITCQENES